jgi:hypothetical protein
MNFTSSLANNPEGIEDRQVICPGWTPMAIGAVEKRISNQNNHPQPRKGLNYIPQGFDQVTGIYSV